MSEHAIGVSTVRTPVEISPDRYYRALPSALEAALWRRRHPTIENRVERPEGRGGCPPGIESCQGDMKRAEPINHTMNRPSRTGHHGPSKRDIGDRR
ncbi:MAG: hypothetical protein N839_0006515 [Desulfofustis sp. PB-SRB1]|nr:hypothetical protein [Desulfofustis sp. PB-SRB1]MBM1002053.1 hypothetical protein [Desulfofustis sp. PB-SRB1]